MEPLDKYLPTHKSERKKNKGKIGKVSFETIVKQHAGNEDK